MSTPKCFVSYSWDSEEHKKWVRELATLLRSNGVDTVVDQWALHPGSDFLNFMETAIRESDYVILVCTQNFAEKANLGIDGVGYEKSIVTGEIYQQSGSSSKYVPILRAGSVADSFPSYL